MKQHLLKLSILTILFSIASCKEDSLYNIDSLDDIDKEMTFFQNGLSFPLGETEPIKLSKLLSKDGDESGLDDLFQTDENGYLKISVDGNTSLNDQFDELDIKSLGSLEGIRHTEKVSYSIGNYDASAFHIQQEKVGGSISFDSFDLNHINIDPISTEVDGIDLNLRDYYLEADVLDLSTTFYNLNHKQELFKVSDYSSYISFVPDNMEVSLPLPESIELNDVESRSFTHQFTVPHSENITGIRNVELGENSKIIVECELLNVFLTSGEITPDVTVDLSSVFDIEGADASGKISLNSIVLSEANSWRAVKEIPVHSFKDSFFHLQGDQIKSEGSIEVEGRVVIENAKTTKAAVMAVSNGHETELNITVSFEGMSIASCDMDLADDVSFESPEQTSIPVNFEFDLPEQVSSVKCIEFDENSPMALTIVAPEIDSYMSSDGIPLKMDTEIHIQFPEGIEVQGAVNNQLVIKPEIKDGKYVKEVVIQSIHPELRNGKLFYHDNIIASVSSKLSGSFSSNNIPLSKENDVYVHASVKGSPKVKDFKVVLADDGLVEEYDSREELEFDVNGIDGVSTFDIFLKDSPVLEFKTDLSHDMEELDIIARNLKLHIPKMFVIDAKGIKGVPASCFSEEDNVLTLNGVIPDEIDLPISHLRVVPIEEDGETIIKDVAVIDGSVVALSKTEYITSKTMDYLEEFGIHVDLLIPEMEAESISMEGKIEKNFQDEYEFTIIKSKDIPSEISYIESIEFDDVNIILELAVESMPSLNSDVLLDADIELPDYFVPNTLKIKGNIEPGRTIKSVQPVQMIKNIDLNGVDDILGKISVDCNISVENPEVDLADENMTMSAVLTAAVGSGSDLDHLGDITIGKAYAKVNYSVEANEKFTIDGIDELRGDNSIFAVEPELTLTFDTNLGIPVIGDITLIPYIDGQAQKSSTVEIKNIVLPYSEDPANNEKKVIKIEEDLSRLVRDLPDEVEISIAAHVDDAKLSVIDPSADYNCTIDYELSIPLSFGDGFNIGISRDFDLEEDLVDVICENRVMLQAVAVNTLPVGLDVKLIFLDEKDEIMDLKNKVSFQVAASDGKGEVFSNVCADLDFKNDSLAKNMKKVRFDINVSATSDVCVKEDDYIQITDIVLSIPEGITVNPAPIQVNSATEV